MLRVFPEGVAAHSIRGEQRLVAEQLPRYLLEDTEQELKISLIRGGNSLPRGSYQCVCSRVAVTRVWGSQPAKPVRLSVRSELRSDTLVAYH